MSKLPFLLKGLRYDDIAFGIDRLAVIPTKVGILLRQCVYAISLIQDNNRGVAHRPKRLHLLHYRLKSPKTWSFYIWLDKVTEKFMKIESKNTYSNKQLVENYTPTGGCLFAGIGGFCGGLKKAGIKTLWANENNENASRTFQANHPDVRIVEKDVCELSVDKDELVPVDILTAGFPCQSFSHAGRKLGFDDERGKLFFEIIRLINEFGEHKPKIILLENVPNLANGDGGKWLQTIITQIQLAGYWFDKTNCHILKTDELSGLPQGRERLFMVATSIDAFYCNDFAFPKHSAKLRPLANFIKRGKKAKPNDYLPPDNRYYKTIATQIEKGGEKSIYQLRRYYVREYPVKCPTLTANMGGGGHNVPFIRDRWGIRRLTVTECATLQGYENFCFPPEVPNNERYRQIGNAVSLPVAEKLAEACRLFYASESRCSKRVLA